MNAKPIWRAVVGASAHSNPGARKAWPIPGVHWLTFACGHATPRRKSLATPKKAVCLACMRLSVERVHCYAHPDGTYTMDVWDPRLKLPRLHVPCDANRFPLNLPGLCNHPPMPET